MKLGFRGEIAAVAAALSLVTLGAAFSAISFAVNRSQQRQFDRALLEVADAEALELSLHPEQVVSISDRPGPSANDVGPLPLFGALYATGGRIVSMTPTFQGAAPPIASVPQGDRQPFDLSWQGLWLRGALVPVPAREAVLLVAASRADLDGDAAFLRRSTLLIFGVAVAWTVLIAVGIASRMTRTHRAIVVTAQRVSAGDLSARVGVGGRGSEMSDLARNIDDMIQRLALLLGRQQQFIAHAAHELRSPLATLYGELSHVLRRPRQGEDYRFAIEQALRSARRLKDLAEDLLTLARLGAGVSAPKEVVVVSQVIADAIAESGASLAERQLFIRVQPDKDADNASVSGRTGELTRMFRNLLENAVRHSPPGGAIVVRSRLSDEHIVVDIVDEGTGVHPEERHAIFLPFFRGAAESSGRVPGAGLGLTIALDIARLHGGTLVVDDAPGPGASFIVRLPLTQSPSPPIPPAR